MNLKTISAMAILEYRAFDLQRKQRTILNILDFHRESKNVPEDLLPQLNEALKNVDLDLNWVQRILRRAKQ